MDECRAAMQAQDEQARISRLRAAGSLQGETKPINSQVTQENDRLGLAVSNLSAKLDTLEGALSKVLRNEPLKPGPEGGKEEELVDLASSLRTQWREVFDLSEKVESILQRIEL